VLIAQKNKLTLIMCGKMTEPRDLDNKILELRTQGCELCLYDDIGIFERAYANRTLSVIDIVKQLKSKNLEASKYKWYNHIRQHLKPEVGVLLSENVPALAQEVVDKIGECVEAIEDIKTKIDQLSLSLTADADPAIVRAYASLQAELRHWVELLAKLQGEFKDLSKITGKNVTIEYNNVMGIILQDACPVCKATFAEKLPKIIKLNED